MEFIDYRLFIDMIYCHVENRRNATYCILARAIILYIKTVSTLAQVTLFFGFFVSLKTEDWGHK